MPKMGGFLRPFHTSPGISLRITAFATCKPRSIVQSLWRLPGCLPTPAANNIQHPSEKTTVARHAADRVETAADEGLAVGLGRHPVHGAVGGGIEGRVHVAGGGAQAGGR